VAGSLATGNIQENSDFDVIVGVKRGRIFTARFFGVALFGLLGWRRKKSDRENNAKNKRYEK
jgi:predicted nucleotidyltransferase